MLPANTDSQWAYQCYKHLSDHPEGLAQALQQIGSSSTPASLKRTLLFVLGALTHPEHPKQMHPAVSSGLVRLLEHELYAPSELLPWMLLSLSSWRGSPDWPQRFEFASNALYTHTTPEGLCIAVREPVSSELTPLVIQALNASQASTSVRQAALETLRFSLEQEDARQAFMHVAQDPQNPDLQAQAAESLAFWVAHTPTDNKETALDALLQAAHTPSADALRLQIQGYLYGQDLTDAQAQRLLDYLEPNQEFTLRDFALYLLGGQARMQPKRWAPTLHALALQDPHPKIRERALDALKSL